MRSKIVMGIFITLFLISMTIGTANAANWQGNWSGPGPKGKWINPPLTFKFEDTVAKAWSAAEKAVAKEAIGEWNKTPGGMKGLITEETDCSKDGDVSLIWAGADFFKDWRGEGGDDLSNSMGRWHGPRNGDPEDNNLNVIKEPDFPQNEIYFNVNYDGHFFDDTTSDKDEEFNPDGTAIPGKGADGKYDFLTVVKHEFGHALGLEHDTTNPNALMWDSLAAGTRKELLDVGYSERRHLTTWDIASLQSLYPVPVGGSIVPVDKFALLAPWIVLAVSVMVAAVSVAVYRRKYRGF